MLKYSQLFEKSKTVVSLLGAMLCLVIVIPKATVICVLILLLLGGLKHINDRVTFCIKPNSIVVLFFALSFWMIVANAWSVNDSSSLLISATKATMISVFVIIFLKITEVHNSKNSHERQMVLFGGGLGYLIVLGAASYAIIFEDSLWGEYFFDPLTTLNNNAVVLALLFWSFLFLMPKKLVSIVTVFIFTFGLLMVLKSLAAVGALIVGGIVFLIRRWLGVNGGILIAAFLGGIILLSPFAVKLSGAEAYSTPEAQTQESSIPPSARHRLAMWSFAVEKIDEKPWLGWGFGASRHIPQEDRRLAPNMEIMPLHPHNLALQTRLELGLPGAIILSCLVFVIFYRLATFTDDGWKSGFAMAPAAGWLFVANVSYGMWQSWWIALAFLIALLMRFALSNEAFEKTKNAPV